MWLQAWYAEACNGEWEHKFGVQIDTLDNPGWSLKIDLQRTRYSGIAMAIIADNHASDSDWIMCKIVDDTFEGQGDPLKLLPIVQLFRKWIENF